MVSRKNGGGNGQRLPAWFVAYLKRHDAEHKLLARTLREHSQMHKEHSEMLKDQGEAIKVLAESVQHLVVEVRESIGKLYEAQAETNARLNRIERELGGRK